MSGGRCDARRDWYPRHRGGAADARAPPRIKNRESDFYLLGWGTGTFDSLEHFNYLIRSDAPYNATGYVNPHVDDLIEAIGTTLVTYARDAMIEDVWKTVREDIVYVPLHQQVIVWAMRDELELPVDVWNQPRFRLARLNASEPGTTSAPGAEAPAAKAAAH
jgi:peptide/nickel transport system substrate-binding protein